jgi:hypothetical protein
MRRGYFCECLWIYYAPYLERAGGNVSEVARQLDLGRKVITRLMREYGIKGDGGNSEGGPATPVSLRRRISGHVPKSSRLTWRTGRPVSGVCDRPRDRSQRFVFGTRRGIVISSSGR